MAGRQVRAYYCDQCLAAVWILPWMEHFFFFFFAECIGKGPEGAGDFASKQHLFTSDQDYVWFTFSIMQLSKGLRQILFWTEILDSIATWIVLEC